MPVQPPSPDRRSRRTARAILVGVAVLLFLAALAVPYRIDTDTGFQLKSVQQWLRGESASPATLLLPDPRDLSRDLAVWSTWWPPGFPLAYTPLAALGLPLAVALRATSLLLFLLGGLGWLRLADDLELSPKVRLLYAISLASYAITLGGAASLRSADLLSFAAGPWLASLVLRLSESRPSALRLFSGGLALGGTYWLRYSLFLTALPLLGFLALRTLYRRPAGAAGAAGAIRIARLAAIGLGFALPILALFALNLRLSENLSETVTGNRSAWRAEDARSAGPAFLALSVVGAPGLGLFQEDLWISHLAYFSDASLPFLRGHDHADRLALRALLGIPGTLLLAWALWRAYRRRRSPIPALALVVTAGFYLALALVSLLVHYNYVANEVRFAAGFMPLIYPFVLAEGLAPSQDRSAALARRSTAVLVAVLFFAPLLFAAAVFVRHDLYARWTVPYRTAGTGLFTPELSPEGPAEVQTAVAAALNSPRDLVVLAGPSDWGSSFVMWLEISQRTLPVSTFYTPLGTRFDSAANLRATSAFTSSREIRVVLVAARSLVATGRLARLQARFPQAMQWTSIPMPPRSEVVVSYADLKP